MTEISLPCQFCGNEHDRVLFSGEGSCKTCYHHKLLQLRSILQFWYPNQWENYKWNVLCTDLDDINALLNAMDLRPKLNDGWVSSEGAYPQMNRIHNAV